MAWTRLDDHFWCNPDIIALSDGAFRAYINSLSAEATGQARSVLDSTLAVYVDELQAARLWDNNGPTPKRWYKVTRWRSKNYHRHRKRLLDQYPECPACGSINNLTIDHIVPVASGGSERVENLWILCRTCNSSKGTKPLEEWRPDLIGVAYGRS